MLHVEFSQMFMPFSAMTFFCLLSGLYAFKGKTSKNRDVTLSVIFALLSFLIHPIGIISIIPLLFNWSREKSYLKFKILFIVALLLNIHYFFHLPSLLLTTFKSYLINYYNYHSSSYLLYSFNFLLLGSGPIAYFSSL